MTWAGGDSAGLLLCPGSDSCPTFGSPLPTCQRDIDAAVSKALTWHSSISPANFQQKAAEELFTAFSRVFHGLVKNVNDLISPLTSVFHRFFTIFCKTLHVPMSRDVSLTVPRVSGTWKLLETMQLASVFSLVPPIFEKT